MQRIHTFLGGLGVDVTNTMRADNGRVTIGANVLPLANLVVIGNSYFSTDMVVQGNKSVLGSIAIGGLTYPATATVTGNIHASANVETGGKFVESGAALIPVGTISMYAANTAPAGWLVCNGDAVSRTTYAALFAVIGTIYGIGDNSTTFNLPNGIRRTPIGSDATRAIGNVTANTFTAASLVTTAQQSTSTSGAGGGFTPGVTTTSVAASAKDSSLTTVVTGVNAVSDHTHTITHTHDALIPTFSIQFIIKH